MRVLVLLAGILDPKWPVAPVGGALPSCQADRLILSPFDEAALETALRIRDLQPDCTLRAIVAGGDQATRLARAVAAFNIADVATLALVAPWDQAALARGLAGLCHDADIILIGREFGDCDDGLVPPMLARLAGCSFFGRAQAVEPGDPVRLLRETGEWEERLALQPRLLASVTNDRRARLRKPLMKNVMMARSAPVAALCAVPDGEASADFVAAHELAGSRAVVRCNMIAGSPEAQAERLADLLLDAAR